MIIFPNLIDPSRNLHLEGPESTAQQTYTLLIRNLKGQLLYQLDQLRLPSTIQLKDLLPGKYMLTLSSEKDYFGALVTAL